ncbi:HAF family extracellular repeat-containing protein [Pandoraea aquatica]|uniref:HAF family extracellular repeat-containing protein n=1 Tax=Pandoraea aquatica TaxID=2508290 RepID=A0A5E4VSF1_9BURK|nr:HAF family extracellular repeat-containing protein [Pandoraea aquatica]
MAFVLPTRPHTRPRRSLVALAASALLSPSTYAADSVSAETPIFFSLPQANATNSVSMSADGSTVIGTLTTPAGLRAFRWTNPTGVQIISDVGGEAAAVNADGSVVVGYVRTGYNTSYAFRWTADGGTQNLGSLGSGVSSNAFGVSADGTTVVGGSLAKGMSEQRAFRWTAASGMTNLGTLGGDASYAISANANGSVVVGWSGASATDASVIHAFRWTAPTGMQDLGTLGGTLSNAKAVSADGNVVAGMANTASNAQRAFRWTSATGLVDLGTLGGPLSVATLVSANGAVVVGGSYTAQGEMRMFRWTNATGMQDLLTLLSNAGVSTSGISLSTVSGLSANGQYIAGDGFRSGPNSTPQVYVIRYLDATVLPKPDPDPATPETPSTKPDGGTSPGTSPGTTTPPPVIAGITTPASVQASADQMGRARQGVMGQMHGFADQMLGEGQMSSASGTSGASGPTGGVAAFGAVGSLAAGITGHLNLAPFEIVAGVGYASETYGDTQMKGAFTAALKLRYEHRLGERFGWFGEIGGFYSPDSNYRFSRNYANGAGTATGSANASGRQAYGFARLGMRIDATDSDQFSQSIELGRQVMRTSTYSEVLSPGNPFEASMGASSSTMNVLKIREKWVHAFTSSIDAALWGAWAHGFNYRDGSQLNVGGIGSLTPQVSSRLNWLEYGARVGYLMTKKAKVSAFVNGVAGGDVGSRTHVGVNLEMFF